MIIIFIGKSSRTVYSCYPYFISICIDLKIFYKCSLTPEVELRIHKFPIICQFIPHYPFWEAILVKWNILNDQWSLILIDESCSSLFTTIGRTKSFCNKTSYTFSFIIFPNDLQNSDWKYRPSRRSSIKFRNTENR